MAVDQSNGWFYYNVRDYYKNGRETQIMSGKVKSKNWVTRIASKLHSHHIIADAAMNAAPNN